MKKVKIEDTETDQPARFYFSLFSSKKRGSEAEPFLRIRFPSDEGLREKAQIVLGAYNEYLSQIYEDLEYIRCYTDNYLVNGRRDYADKAMERSANLQQNIKRIYVESK